MRKRTGMIPIILGLLLLLGAAGLTLRNLNEEYSAGRASDAALEKLSANMDRAPHQATDQELMKKEDVSEEDVLELDGQIYMGLITFPTLDLQLPVQTEWSYPNLKKSPCRMQGSPSLENLVIMGHNYRTHFGPLARLETGDEVSVTLCDGTTYVYQVSAKEIVEPYAVEDVTSGEWPLTLFTCTPGGRTRRVIRCDLAA